MNSVNKKCTTTTNNNWHYLLKNKQTNKKVLIGHSPIL